MRRARKFALVLVAIFVVAALSAFLGLLPLYAHLYRETVTITALYPLSTTTTVTMTTTVTATALGWRFWHEYSGHAVFPTGPAHSTIDFSPLTLPQEFYVSTISSKPSRNIEWGQPTVAHFYHYFGIQLNEGDRLPYAFRATAPIHFQIVFVNQTTTEFPRVIGLAYHPDQVLNDTIESVGFGELVAQAKGLYILVFEPLEAPNLTQSIAVIFSHYPIPVQWTTVTTTTSETVTVSLNQTVTVTFTTRVKIPMSPFDQPSVRDYPLRAAAGTLPTYIQIELARGQASVRLT